jgi:hypothetical protein
MADRKCYECGRMYDGNIASGGKYDHGKYCSAKCARAGEAVARAESAENTARLMRLIGIALMAIAALFTVLCYKFPKFLKGKNKKLLYAYIITWAVLIAGAVVYFSFFSPEAVSGIKIEIVSASCETQEKFVEIATEALSGVSGALLEGEEFTTYSQKARDAVKKREGEHGLYKDAVYSVRLPDKVNAYVWFESENKARAIVYKTE